MQLPEAAWTTLLASWSPSTAKTYEGVVKRWLTYTVAHGIHPIVPTIMEAVNFLTEYFNTGVGHSSMNTTRSCLSSFIVIDGTPLGEIPVIARFIKGTRRVRPPGGKVTHVWNPLTMLHHLQEWGPTAELTLQQLTRRTMLLFLLATGQRLQALHLMKRTDFQWEADSLKIKYTDRLKTNDPIDSPLVLLFKYHEEETLCVFSHIKAYLANDDTAPAAPYVFSTVRLPTSRATSATISRQVKATLASAGIHDFTAYTARHAATSAASRANVPLNTILQSASWVRESTFSRFYNRPLLENPPMEETNFIPRLLE